MMYMTLCHDFCAAALSLCCSMDKSLTPKFLSDSKCLSIAACEFTQLQINTSNSPISAMWKMRNKLGWEVLLGSSDMVAYG